MLNKTLKTPVDSLVELIKANDNCSIAFLQEKLQLPIDIIEKWVVILEEYNVIKVDYRGFDGFVRFVYGDSNSKSDKAKEEAIDINKLKEKFVAKAQKRNLTENQMANAWPKFVLAFEKEIRLLFFEKSKDRGYSTYKIADAWNKYRENLIKW